MLSPKYQLGGNNNKNMVLIVEAVKKQGPRMRRRRN